MRGFMVCMLVAVGLVLSAETAAAYDSCGGRVHGLSAHYNPATGSGFLAVRAGPRSSASQIGELFNGDEVVILGRQGNWYRIDAQGIGLGWAYYKWIHRLC